MHPVLARFLDPHAVRDVLRREEAGEPLDAAERALADVARERPEERRALMGKAVGRHAPGEVQAALTLLAANAAVRVLGEDARLGGPLRQAREVLGAQGASPEETAAFLASILLEEAFGYESDPDSFDARMVEETLAEVPALATLTRERVDGLVEAFLQGGASEEARAVRARVASALVNTAWGEGPTPINPEHIEALIESELEGQSEESQEAAVGATVEFLEALAREGLVGATRLGRLKALLGEE